MLFINGNDSAAHLPHLNRILDTSKLLNDTIPRKDILNLLWGNDNFFNSRNLDVYINKLRGYLKKDTTLEILTIKGVGYRFIIS
jgi:Response regulators consisting of a CheY-like receiver domain and a winged-helix DNA-binding domain